jgi:hypothetical protein
VAQSQVTGLATALGERLTTNTAQALATGAAKTFPTGTVLLGTGTTPIGYSAPASSAMLYSPDGKALRLIDSAGVETAIGGGAGSNDPLDLPTEFTSGNPAVPTAGVTLFTRHRARRMLAQIGPSGLDTILQPAIFSNRIARWNAVNALATPTMDGLSVTNYSAPTAVQNATNNFYNSMVRNRFQTNATAGTGTGFRTAAQWHLSSTANKGGFFFVCRFGLNLITATNRIFIGLANVTGALPNAEPSTFTNIIGFGSDSSQTTMRFLRNGNTGTATAVDLGANFSTSTAGQANSFYEVRLFSPSGGGSVVNYSATRLNDGAFIQGSATTALPALDLILAAQVWHQNGSTAAAVNLDVQSLYIETDN